MELAQYFNKMKKSELKQIIKEEIKKVLAENTPLTPEKTYQELRKEYWEGDNLEGLYNDERFKSLPKKMQDKLSLIIFNNMRQNYY
jgi:predicted transcriptional regulator